MRIHLFLFTVFWLAYVLFIGSNNFGNIDSLHSVKDYISLAFILGHILMFFALHCLFTFVLSLWASVTVLSVLNDLNREMGVQRDHRMMDSMLAAYLVTNLVANCWLVLMASKGVSKDNALNVIIVSFAASQLSLMCILHWLYACGNQQQNGASNGNTFELVSMKSILAKVTKGFGLLFILSMVSLSVSCGQFMLIYVELLLFLYENYNAAK